MKERLARLTTNIINPFLVSFIVIVLLAFKSADTVSNGVKWALISLALSVLPVFIVTTYLVRRKKMDGFFTNPREQRNIIYVLASALAALSCGLLWYLKAPRLLAVTFTAGLAAIVVFTVINYFWKISLHTAFMAAAVVVVVIVYGATAAGTFILLPLVAWARIQLKQHSVAQVVISGLLAPAIVAAVFRGFSFIG
jgi:membrane-associated HD superfamily phosphohydrolase